MPSTITDRLYGLTTSVAVKAPCRVVATSNITLSGLQAIDGITLVANDRVLNIGQTTGADNGIWLAQSGAWTRPGDWDGSLDAVMGTQILVTSGTDNALTQWIVTTSGTIIVGTTSVSFAEFNADANTSVTPGSFGAVGNGVTDDTTALLNAIASCENVTLEHGKTYLFSSDLTGFCSHQYFGGSGILKPAGGASVVVDGAVTGVELELTFNSATHSDYAIKIMDASRTRIKRFLAIDAYGGIYIEEANQTTIDYVWATLRGPGIKWYGSTTKRSDILNVNNATIQPGTGFYGFDWDGECHTFDCTNMRINCGLGNGRKGIIIRNTDGNGSSFPAIGRFFNAQVDYPDGNGIEIGAGLDYDFIGCYVLGATQDGFKINSGTAPASSVDDYGIRILGGKSVGNTGYGINNDGGVVLWDGATTISDNTAGKVDGNLWVLTEGGRLALDATSYFTLLTGNPQFAFDTNDYMAYDRSLNTLRFFVGSAESATITSGGINLSIDKMLTLPASSATRAQINFGEGVEVAAPNEGDFWLEGNVFKYRASGVTNALALQAASSNQTGLISGGQVVWETGLTFRVAAAQYYIAGQIYESIEQTVTLAAADGTNPRIDVIYLDTAGTANDITGTAAANPSEPDVDPSTQLKLTFVLVGAGVSTPSGVSNESIYLENTEWTGTTSGAGWTLNSATSPYAGTVNVVAAAVASGGYVSFDHGAAITLTDYDILQLFIKPTVAFPAGRVIRAQWYNNGVALGIPQTIASGYWGFNAATLSYQLVAIPMVNFVLPAGTTGDQLRLTVTGGALSFQLDNIVLQVQGASVPQTGGSGLTQAQADARYVPLPYATTAEYRANTANKPLGTDEVWAAAAYVALTDAATVAVDMSLGFNFSLTIGGNRTLGAPSNTKDGQTGAIVITQDGTGSRTLAYHANWKFAGGTDPTLSTAAGAVDVLFYQVISSTSIIGNLVKAIA